MKELKLLQPQLGVGQVKQLSLNQTENCLCLLDAENTLHFYDVFSKSVFLHIPLNFEARAVQFTKNSNFVLLQSEHQLTLYDVVNRKPRFKSQFAAEIRSFQPDLLCKYKVLLTLGQRSVFLDLKTDERVEVVQSPHSALLRQSLKDHKLIVFFENGLKQVELMHNKFKTIPSSLLSLTEPILALKVHNELVALLTPTQVLVFNLDDKTSFSFEENSPNF